MSFKSPTSATPNLESPVRTVSELSEWHPGGVPLAVLGFPIKHSVSPPMHNTALSEMAVTDPRFDSWRYHRIEVRPEELARVLPLLHAKRFHGVNLTIPHKIMAVDLVAGVEEEAALTGAVNTLVWREDGYHGYNTDGYGLETALREELGVTLAGAPVVLLGAGGAARAAAVLCLRRGCRRLWLGNRTVEKLDPLRRLLESIPGEVEIQTFALGNPPSDWPDGVMVINATSAGLRAEDAPPLDVQRLPPSAVVYDMIYNPAVPAMVRSARDAGLRAANGLSMLVHQGARSLEIWSGAAVPSMTMARAAAEAMAGQA